MPDYPFDMRLEVKRLTKEIAKNRRILEDFNIKTNIREEQLSDDEKEEKIQLEKEITRFQAKIVNLKKRIEFLESELD